MTKGLPTPSDAEWRAEQQRQSNLLQAILSFQPSGHARDWLAPQQHTEPLRPYQGHVRVLAAQVLGQIYPTLQSLLGDEPWPQIAQSFWQQYPPTQGPLHVWGQPFADWVSEQQVWRSWPFLSDMARLDWALHESLIAAKQSFDDLGLPLLHDANAHNLRLRLTPGLRVIKSPWPVVSIYLAHQTQNNEAFWQTAREMIQAGQGQCACICQGVVSDLPQAWGDWLAELSDASDSSNLISLGNLLDKYAAAVDFSAWMTAAVSKGWLWRIEKIDATD